LLDGETKDVAIPGKRKKWAQVLSILDKLSWIRLECLNAKGSVVDIIENDDPAEDLEDLDGYGGQVHQLTGLMLKAQDIALRRNADQTKQQNEMILGLAKLLMERLNALEKGFAANLKMAQRFAMAAAESGDEDELFSSPLVEALAPHLLKRFLDGGIAPGNNDGTKS
jgi:hypothetical protein